LRILRGWRPSIALENDIAACAGFQFRDRWPACFFCSRSCSAVSLRRIEMTKFLFDDVLSEIEHVLGDLDVLDVVEIFRFIEPALATSIDKVPTGERWIHEIEFDGYWV
jgi:hypothetical protein